MRRPGDFARADQCQHFPIILYHISSVKSSGLAKFFCFIDLKWYSAKSVASRSGVKFCARPDRCVVSNFKGYTSCKTSWNQLSPSSCEASCNPPSCAAPCQLQIARAVKFLPAATSRQILIVHGSCKPAVKFLYQLQLRQAATLVKFYEGKPAGSFIFLYI